MLVTTNPQRTLWEAVLPPGHQDLPALLTRVDALLDDPVFFEPYRRHFSAVLGRPSIPIETYLRMMFLKHRYGLGYETLCGEVADSLTWMRFCRIPLGTRVPHPSTLGKLTRRCGAGAIDALNEALLGKAHDAKVVKTGQVRTDTTVVPADVKYPTDSGLLVRAITLIVGLVAGIHLLGVARRTTVRDRRHAARRRARMISAHLKLRNDEAKATVLRITGELAGFAETTVADATRVLINARRFVAAHPDKVTRGLTALIGRLSVTIERAGRVVEQTRTRLAGEAPSSASRLVSMHDPDARPIAKGRLGKPVEFGYKAQVVDNVDGIVLDHSVHVGNPADGPLLVPAIRRIAARFGLAPAAVTADRGYGEAKIEAELAELGVETVAIPRKGKPSKARRDIEQAPKFHRLVKWRTGSEGRISYLKRRFGWDRTLLATLDGAETWCGLGVFTHNTGKIAGLVAAAATPDRPAPATKPRPAPAPPRRGTRPPPPTTQSF
jgi:IS5 family transposase